jgi:hypothetical protein
MATNVGNMTVTLNLDDATAALVCIRAVADMAFAKDTPQACADALRDIRRAAEAALAKCRAEADVPQIVEGKP